MPAANIDTDQIIPKQFLKTVEREGLGKGLFYDFRFDPEGKEKPDFVLNQPAYPGAGDPDRRRQFRLRLQPRARPLGASGLRHPLRDLHQLRRHLLQQLLPERPFARHRPAADDLHR